MSKICYIVGAGEDYGIDFTPDSEDLVIAADGGLLTLQKAGIQPQTVIGDFDSLGTIPGHEQVVVLPTVKDVTDTWAAIEWAKERGFREFHLYGCTGGRVEHTLANIQTAAALAEAGMHCLIYDKEQIIAVICNETISFPSEKTGFLSVFSYTDICGDVTLEGLKYELEHAELTNRFPLGVSNEFVGKEAFVTVRQGIAVVVYGRN